MTNRYQFFSGSENKSSENGELKKNCGKHVRLSKQSM